MKDRLPAPLVSLLHEAGELAEQHRVRVYAVGGFVRDLLLGVTNLDVDLVVEGNGIAFARTFARKRQARVTVHERFGTAVVTLEDGFKFDVATARTEYYDSPAALPTVKQGSIKEDLARRDFTINTLAISLNAPRFGEVVDDNGGRRDLQNKSIRVLHPLSFIEDPTRVFRAVRFEQRLGFRLDAETATLMKEEATRDAIQRLSPARLSKEMILVLSERQPRTVLARLADFDLLRCIHPELKWSPQLARLLKDVEETLTWHDRLARDRLIRQWVVYHLALMDSLPTPAVQETLSRFTFPRGQTRRTLWVTQEGPRLLRTLNQRTTPSEVFRLLRDLPDETLLFFMAKIQSESEQQKIAALFTTPEGATPVLKGNDLKAMGLKPGPVYQRVLDRLLDARLDGEVTTEADEREFIARLRSSASSADLS